MDWHDPYRLSRKEKKRWGLFTVWELRFGNVVIAEFFSCADGAMAASVLNTAYNNGYEAAESKYGVGRYGRKIYAS